MQTIQCTKRITQLGNATLVFYGKWEKGLHGPVSIYFTSSPEYDVILVKIVNYYFFQ